MFGFLDPSFEAQDCSRLVAAARLPCRPPSSTVPATACSSRCTQDRAFAPPARESRDLRFSQSYHQRTTWSLQMIWSSSSLRGHRACDGADGAPPLRLGFGVLGAVRCSASAAFWHRMQRTSSLPYMPVLGLHDGEVGGRNRIDSAW